MGAGLAAQRGWPQELPSPRDTDTDPLGDDSAHTSRSNESLVGDFEGTIDETQPLEMGEGWGYHSTASVTSLVPVEKRWHASEAQHEAGGDEGGGTGIGESTAAAAAAAAADAASDAVIAEDADLPLRESRAPSVAYDLGALSTEEEVCLLHTAGLRYAGNGCRRRRTYGSEERNLY